MLRLVNTLVIASLVLAAGYVYKIKFEATLQAERVAKMRQEIRRERETVAILRAEWAQLDRPDRIQMLAQRHLKLRPVEVAQFDQLLNLPEKPVPLVPPGTTDPIGAMIDIFSEDDTPTGSVPSSAPAPR